MKSPASFIAGFIVGIAAAIAAFAFWPHPSVNSALTSPSRQSPVPTTATESHATTSLSSDIIEPPASNLTDQSMQDALREIREAGMIVIPHEFARFMMPSLVSTRPDAAVREILQLDEREADALGKARMKFDRAFSETVNAHLQITESNEGVLTGILPEFKEERKKLLDAWRSESLQSLDPESAALFAHIDLDQALSSQIQGSRELAVKIVSVPNDDRVFVELSAVSEDGPHKRSIKQSAQMGRTSLLRLYPSLKEYLPAPTKP
jgi:hypothetical protein